MSKELSMFDQPERLVQLTRGSDNPDDPRYGLAVVTLNRADAMNAINVRLAEQLSNTFEFLYNDTTIRCVVLKAAGKFFMAGGDIDDFARPIRADDEALLIEELDELIDHCQEAIRWIRYAPKPIIACVPGGAAGYGLSLMLACDFAITTESAVFSLAYSGLGTSPDGGASFFLPRLVGARKATELMMLSERFKGTQAAALDLVNDAVPDDQLDARVEELVERVLTGPTVCYGKVKSLVNSAYELTLSDQLAAEVQSFKACALTDDFKEGVIAFTEKRSAKFQGQ